MAKNKSKAQGDPAAIAAAQTVVFEAVGLDPADPTVKPKAWKVGCYFGGCDRTFDPNGSGSIIHRGCDAARPFASHYATLKGEAKEAFAAKCREQVAAKS